MFANQIIQLILKSENMCCVVFEVSYLHHSHSSYCRCAVKTKTMDKSFKYFSHYFKEIQTTRDKFKDYIIREEPETVKLIEMDDFGQNIFEGNEKQENSVDEKSQLIEKVLELSRTLDDINVKLVAVKKDSVRLEEENKVIENYVENLMLQSKTFGPATL